MPALSPDPTVSKLLRSFALAATIVAGFAIPALAQTGGGSPPAAPPGPPPPPAAPTPKLIVDAPSKKLLIREGQAGRLNLDGRWYFRLDDAFVGNRQRFFRQRSLAGWSPIRLPHNWNAQDTTQNRSSVGWYRREFKLPRAPRGRRFQWKVRFESAIARATVYLNGRKLGYGAPGYLPFELDLRGLKKGRNRLVVRVSNLRSTNDLTHWRPARFNGFGSGGWWNFGGLSREVYLRRIEGVDIEDVTVVPRQRCVRCQAKVGVLINVRNLSRRNRRAGIALTLRGKRLSRRIDLSPRELVANGRQEVRTSFVIKRPRLWQPGRPNLYHLTTALATGGKRRASYVTDFGVRTIKRLRDGRVLLNGRRLQLRGASIHEDEPGTGAALRPAQRKRIVRRLRELGATITRAHYPLHPSFLEAFDRTGIVYWSQAPVYQLPAAKMAISGVRKNAVRLNRRIVRRDQNHPSIIAWSIANELPDEGTPAQQAFIDEAAEGIRDLDRTRLVAIDRQSRVGQLDPVPAIQRLDAIGVNEYFGWYNASLRPDPAHPGRYLPSATSDLGPFLDTTHRLYPRQPLFVTEFGAESNRNGPAAEKGSFRFQTGWMRDHLRIHAARPFVNGSIAWILKDFRVHERWAGGNPRPNPPWNNKGLIDESGRRKPAYFAMQRLWRRTRPLR